MIPLRLNHYKHNDKFEYSNTMTYQRIPCAILLLLAAVLALTSAFQAPKPYKRTTVLRADVEVNESETSRDSVFLPQQKDFGQSLELPDTYASCGQCGASFALTLEAMGPGKGGRRMHCSVCDHTWFQSRERLTTLGDGFEMVPLPERDLSRIQLNIKEGHHPKYQGSFKMYVGNISFKCTEEDLYEVFEAIGPVGDVSMVLDNETGRPRGFGFVSMRNKADGERALEELDGLELKGRNLNVRPSSN